MANAAHYAFGPLLPTNSMESHERKSFFAPTWMARSVRDGQLRRPVGQVFGCTDYKDFRVGLPPTLKHGDYPEIVRRLGFRNLQRMPSRIS